MLHLSTSGPFKMVFEHLWECFHPKDSASEFLQLFQFCSHITQGHITHQIVCVFGGAHLLTMTKLSSGTHPIVV
jgi:hypothetical protein